MKQMVGAVQFTAMSKICPSWTVKKKKILFSSTFYGRAKELSWAESEEKKSNDYAGMASPIKVIFMRIRTSYNNQFRQCQTTTSTTRRDSLLLTYDFSPQSVRGSNYNKRMDRPTDQQIEK